MTSNVNKLIGFEDADDNFGAAFIGPLLPTASDRAFAEYQGWVAQYGVERADDMAFERMLAGFGAN